MASCVTELTCIHCGAAYPGSNLVAGKGTWMTCPKCGPADGVLDIGYDLDCVRDSWKRRPLAQRPLNHWRYSELLPLEPEAVRHEWSVGWTPIIDTSRLSSQLGLKQLLLKDDGRNPTASFKDRASSVGVASRPSNSCEIGRLRLDRECGQQFGRARRACRFARVHFRAGDGTRAQGCAAASIRGKSVCRESFLRCRLRPVLEGL